MFSLLTYLFEMYILYCYYIQFSHDGSGVPQSSTDVFGQAASSGVCAASMWSSCGVLRFANLVQSGDSVGRWHPWGVPSPGDGWPRQVLMMLDGLWRASGPHN